MTRYTVIWDDELLRVFTDTWVKSDSATRAILTDVANWVDTNLAAEPASKAQVDVDGIYIVWVPISLVRVSVSYEVHSDDRVVHVIRFNFRR